MTPAFHRAGILVQVSVSKGGMPKVAVECARVAVDGVENDWQKNRKYHGGANRAVCLFSTELYDELRCDGIELEAGSLGENFTSRGIDLNSLGPGVRLKVGACEIEITGVRVPCRSLDQWDKGLKALIQNRSGWVAKVVKEGDVRPGDPILVVG